MKTAEIQGQENQQHLHRRQEIYPIYKKAYLLQCRTFNFRFQTAQSAMNKARLHQIKKLSKIFFVSWLAEMAVVGMRVVLDIVTTGDFYSGRRFQQCPKLNRLS